MNTRPSTSKTRSCLVIAAASFLLAGTASAVDIDWDNAADGNWQDSANWNPAQVPGSGDVGIFGLGATGYEVGFTGNVTSGLEVDNQEGLTFDIGAANTFTIENNAWIGVDNIAELTVTRGTLQSTVTNRLFRNSGSSGSFTLTGSDTTWNTGSGAGVGGTNLVREGSASVNIENGATINAETGGGRFDLGAGSGSDGTLNIDGVGSEWDGTGVASGTGERFRLAGSGAEATVNISNGGVLEHNGSIRTNGGDARATVEGTDSLLKTGSDLRISNNTVNSGEEFLVQDGGRIEVDNQGGTSAFMRDAGFAIEGATSTIEITGDHEFERGDLRVLLSDAMAGNTTALMTVGGDLTFTDNGAGDNDFLLGLERGFSGNIGDVFDIIDFGGDRLGNMEFDNIADGATVEVNGFEFLADYGTTNNDTFSLELTAVPEPHTYAMLFGLVALAGAVMRRRCR